MSERQVEDLIQKQLKERQLVTAPQVSVLAKELHAREVTVAGEVKTPGVYPIRGGEALIDLISKAGGLSPTASNYAYVLRGAATDARQTTGSADRTIKVDLVALLLRGEQQWNFPLMAGDRITVPTLGWLHMTGLGIDKPGTYQLRTTPTTLRQAVDDAGGLKYAADRQLLIVRRNPDGRQETFTMDYNKIMQDEKNDILVQGGDTVVVNRTPVKTAVAFVGSGIEKIVRVSFNFGGYIPLFGDRYYD
jgi:polysaccharide export outer membrane protein